MFRRLEAAGRSRALRLSMPPIGPQPTTAVVRGHDENAERREGVTVDRVVSALELGHSLASFCHGRPCLRPHRHGRAGW